MNLSRRLGALAFAVSIVVAACGGTTATTAPESSAATESSAASPAANPSESASAAAVESVAPSQIACQAANLQTVAPGTLTVGTDNPAYPPYFSIPSSGNPPAPWKLGDPTNGQGFESAFAYALADQLGYTKDQVKWIVVPFNNSFAPGPKPFDVDINQISYTKERATAVDMSDGYYYLTQAVVALKSNPIAKVTSIADLKAYKLGAQQGTTSYSTITDVVAPAAKPMVYNTNDDAISALKAKQIDGLVVDLPTAFYITAAQLDNSTIAGQFPPAGGADSEHFSVVLAKGSPLTACVNQAIGSLTTLGILNDLKDTYLAKAGAPVFRP
ncbi:MAG TPA: ABC transporter substrate-binding protein [Candidatus Limnocylindrales bacterium]